MICVGNLTAGGAGKTPTVIALVERLAARGVAAHVVSRGHGGSLAGPVRVDERAAHAPPRSATSRCCSPPSPRSGSAATAPPPARAAAAAGAQAVVMDDGFQNPALAKDLSIVVVDAGFGFGNGRVMPAGPLREPVADGLARADLVLAIGDAARRARALRGRLAGARGAAGGSPGALAPLADRHGLARPARRSPSPASAGRRSSSPPCAPSAPSSSPRTASPTTRPIDRAPAGAARAPRRARRGPSSSPPRRTPSACPPPSAPKVLVLPVRLEIEDWAPLDAALARLGL